MMWRSIARTNRGGKSGEQMECCDLLRYSLHSDITLVFIVFRGSRYGEFNCARRRRTGCDRHDRLVLGALSHPLCRMET